MPKTIVSRKPQGRLYTPPPDLRHRCNKSHPRTPSRTAVITAKLIAQRMGITIPRSIVREITGVPESMQSRILASHEVRTLYNQSDVGPDPRGRPRAFTRNETIAVEDYLQDPLRTLSEKGAPWPDIVEEAGVALLKIKQ